MRVAPISFSLEQALENNSSIQIDKSLQPEEDRLLGWDGLAKQLALAAGQKAISRTNKAFTVARSSIIACRRPPSGVFLEPADAGQHTTI